MKKLILTVIIFLSFQVSVHSGTDCSNLKKLSKEYLSCLTSKEKKNNFRLVQKKDEF